jgi:hypothetical protein
MTQMATWMHTIADLYEKTQSKEWAGARLRDWTLVDRFFGAQFDRDAHIKSNPGHEIRRAPSGAAGSIR